MIYFTALHFYMVFLVGKQNIKPQRPTKPGGQHPLKEGPARDTQDEHCKWKVKTSILRSTVQSENQVIISFKNSGRNSPVVLCPSLEFSKLGFLWLIEKTSCIYQKKLVYKAHPNQLAWQVKHPWNLHNRSWYEDGKFGPRKQCFINDSVLN